MTRRRLLALLGAAPLAAAGWFGWARGRNPYYDGPPSDHFDGLRFFHPEQPPDKSPIQAFRALRLAEKAPWPESWPSPFADRPPPEVTGPRLRVVSIGHATHLIQAAGLNILTDPVWSERCSPVSFAGPKRVCPPGVAFEDLPRIDVVLLSHNHYDHLDTATLARLVARDDPRIVTALGNDVIVRADAPRARVEAHDWGDRVELGHGVTASLVTACHWSARGVTDRRKALWTAFAIDAGEAGRVYFAGDTGFFSGAHFRKAAAEHGPFRLAILPIGAYEPRWFMKDQHLNPAEAVEAFSLLGAEHAIGCHWGVFRLTAEAIDAPAAELATALRARGVPPERFRALRPGEAWEA